MKSIMSQNPCKTCNADVQKGNPYYWQTPCHNCKKKLSWENARHDRIVAIERILGDDYDLDHLRELVVADRDKRCAILSEPMRNLVYRPGDTDVYCPNCNMSLSGGWALSDADDNRKLCQCPYCGQSIDDTKCVSEDKNITFVPLKGDQHDD